MLVALLLALEVYRGQCEQTLVETIIYRAHHSSLRRVYRRALGLTGYLGEFVPAAQRDFERQIFVRAQGVFAEAVNPLVEQYTLLRQKREIGREIEHLDGTISTTIDEIHHFARTDRYFSWQMDGRRSSQSAR